MTNIIFDSTFLLIIDTRLKNLKSNNNCMFVNNQTVDN